MPVYSKIELEFENVGFWGQEKTGVPGEKSLGAEKKTNNKLNPHMTPGPRFESGTHTRVEGERSNHRDAIPCSP